MPKKWGLGLGFTGFDDAAINKAPTDIAWAGSHTVAEDTALGTQVGGLLTATDPESGPVTFTLTDDAGGLFSLGAGGNTIIVTGVLDFETATSHSITIRATDEELATYDESFTITVSDVSESVPSNPLPDDGVTDVDDAASFDVLPTATVVDAGVKIHGKKSANGSTGKFIYDFENFAVNTTFVMKYSADWSLLSNTGKNVFVGFGSREENSFDLVGLRSDGTTGIHKVRMNGASPNGWSQLSGHTVNDGGAAANGDQDGINWIALSIRADGTHYDFLTSADGAAWSGEYSNQALGSLSTLVGNDVDGIAAVFAGTDTGPFSFNVLDYHSVPAPTITSASTKSQAENATMTHALTANQTVTWSIVGGADQARLEISGSTLRWASNGTKDFEAPNDADTNNTYIVTVRATNVFGSTTDQTITVTVTDVADDPLDPYTTGLTGAWSMGRRLVSAYGAGSFFTNASGFVSVLNDQAGSARNFTSGAGARPTVTTAGPLSRQAADFVSNGIFLTAAALSNFIANNNGFFVVVCQIDAYTNANNRPLLDITNDNININITAGGQTPLAKNNDGSSDFAAAASTMSTAAPHVITWRHEGGTLFCSLDGGSEGAGAASGNTSSLAGLLQLSSSSTSWFDGKIYELYVWNVAPSSGNRAAIIAQAKTYAGVS